ncbi:MAG: 3-phosphoshikimate 1-carboxyvinyltransferase, partial [Candidatus Omnitrophota bacterium]|nr:3-phosphoshikimate 1-carboxyvinyltransferase [Candidatus Omnitrophota bacterium]
KAISLEEKDLPLLIDEIPILAVVASKAEGQTIIKGASELRIKETDRVFSITENLAKLGVDIRAKGDDIIINGSKKRFAGSASNSFGDHRTAMAMAIAALASDGESVIKNTDCINTSFPEFFQVIDYLKK